MEYSWESIKELNKKFIENLKNITKALIYPHIEAFKFKDIRLFPIVVLDVLILLFILTIIINIIKK